MSKAERHVVFTILQYPHKTYVCRSVLLFDVRLYR